MDDRFSFAAKDRGAREYFPGRHVPDDTLVEFEPSTEVHVLEFMGEGERSDLIRAWIARNEEDAE